jgi:hypothetical protein
VIARGPGEKPRFALICGGSVLEPWHVECLDQLSGVAELAAVLVTSEPQINERLAGVPHVSEPAELPEVDAVLRLGRHAIPPGLTAELGVWRFEHEDRHDEPFLREVYDGSDVTRVALLCSLDGRPPLVDAGYLPTAKGSYRANRDRALAYAAQLPRRVVERHRAGGAWPVDAGPDDEPASGHVRPSLLRLRLARRRLALAWTRLFRHPQWNIGILRLPVGSLLESGYREEDVEWFPLHGRSAFLADPFGLRRGETIMILCERFPYRGPKGHIAVLEHSSAGFVEHERPAIEQPTHMSYPFLVDLDDGVRCVPETAVDGQVTAFVATRFPDEWRPDGPLLPDVAGIDPTLFPHEGRWWLAAGKHGLFEDVELYLWHAPSPDGPWVPHAANPVKADVRSARPGGRPFVHNGALYRPAQDSGRRYGARIALQRVVRLTPTEFAEETVRLIEARPGDRRPVGPHTLSPIDDDLVLVDACQIRFVPGAFVAFLRIWARDVRQKLSKSPNV